MSLMCCEKVSKTVPYPSMYSSHTIHKGLSSLNYEIASAAVFHREDMFLSKALQLHFSPGNAVIDTKAPLNWFMRTSMNQVWPPDLVRGQAWHNNCPLNIFYFGPGNMGNDNKHRPSRCARPPHPVRGEHKPGLLKIRRLATET